MDDKDVGFVPVCFALVVALALFFVLALYLCGYY